MPRDGSNVYTQPFPDVIEGTTIESAVYNGFTNDVTIDLNNPRPVVAGGTGATTPDSALAQLTAEKASQVVTNYDSHIWQPGSFWSATSATGSAVTGHAFAGIVYMSDSDNIIVEAIDRDDTLVPPRKYIRQKKAGTWGTWNAQTFLQSTEFVKKTGDSMSGALTLIDNGGMVEQLIVNSTRTDGNVQAALTGSITGLRRWSIRLVEQGTVGPAFNTDMTIGYFTGPTYNKFITLHCDTSAANKMKITFDGDLHVNGVITHTP